MPERFNWPSNAVTRIAIEHGYRVEWRMGSEILFRDYTYVPVPKDDRQTERRRISALERADAFVFELSGSPFNLNGPTIYCLTDADLAERERVAELRRELFTGYVAAIIDHEDAGPYADQLGIPRDRIDADNRTIQKYLACRELFDGLDAARQKLDEFHQSHKANWDDAMILPSNKQQYARLKIAVENARSARSGMLDCQRAKPDFFVTIGHEPRLVCETVAA